MLVKRTDICTDPDSDFPEESVGLTFGGKPLVVLILTHEVRPEVDRWVARTEHDGKLAIATSSHKKLHLLVDLYLNGVEAALEGLESIEYDCRGD